MNIEQPIFPADLARQLGIQIKTLARMIKAGRVPPYDVVLSQKLRYWHRATLLERNIIT